MLVDDTKKKSSESLGKYGIEEIESSRSFEDLPAPSNKIRPGEPPLQLTPAEERQLYRKVDLRVMPMLILMYTCSFLDRGEHHQLVSRTDMTEVILRKHWSAYTRRGTVRSLLWGI